MPSPVNSVPLSYIYPVAAVLFSSLVGLTAWILRRAAKAVETEWKSAMDKLDVIQNNHCEPGSFAKFGVLILLS
jgi:hypothetical protein